MAFLHHGERFAPALLLVTMTAVRQVANLLTEKIRTEIEADGPMPFARFMELALYHPEWGYYETKTGRVGRCGDFITSVSVGTAFGHLLAYRFGEWLGDIDGPVQLVEAGAHDGPLAHDILTWLAANNEPLLELLTYIIVEPSAKRRGWQVKRLAKFGEKVEWVESIAELPEIRGVIFSNELLDAFPVHRIGWSQANYDWFEWSVTWESDSFSWAKEKVKKAAWRSLLPAWPSALLEVLPDGYSTELSPAATEWWSGAAKCLAKGKLLAFDYGYGPEDWPAVNQPDGTVRGYRDQKRSDDVLVDPGKQDITAHANFGLAKLAGKADGLATEQFISQERFLNGAFADLLRASPALGQAIDVRQLQTLTHPAHMGQSFRVLVQSR